MKKVSRNVPESLLRAQISDLSLEEIAKSYEFKSLIENSIAALLRSHNRSRYINYSISYDSYDPLTACTDNNRCYLNAAHEMFRENPDVEDGEIDIKESCQRIYGAAFHEGGHILYTCFSEMKRLLGLFEVGELDIPAEELTGDMLVSYNELKDLMKNENAVVFQGFNVVPIKMFIAQLYARLMNIIEDGRIENLLLKNDTRYSGLHSGLLKLREYHMKKLQNSDLSNDDIPTFMDLCLLYAKYDDFGNYTGGFECFDLAVPIIDQMLETHEAKVFSQLNMKVLLCLWPKIKELIEEIDGNAGDGNAGDGDCDSSQDNKDSQDSENSSGSPDNSQSSENKESADQKQGSSQKDSSENPQNESQNQSQQQLEQKLQEILDKISEKFSEEQSTQNDAGETKQKQGEAASESKVPSAMPEGSTTLDATLGDIMKQLADKKARDAAEEEACESIKGTIKDRACSGRGFAPYFGTRVHTVTPSEYLPENLDDVTEAAIKKAAREIQRYLETDQRTGVSKRKFSGKKFHANKVVNRDFRYFEDKATKKDLPKVKVGLVIDESGSMETSNRYAVARTSAITLYKIFEYIPNLDVAIYGHTTKHEVEIFNYTDFGIKQKNVIKKLNNISARGGNIDIVPITAMAENLLRQDADARVMFIITDGLPYSYVQNMTPEEELSIAANNYSRKGIDIIVASVGDDEKRLREIYKNQRFLNLSDPTLLPKKVVDVIKRKL